jgi:hypothetical protein
MNAIDSITPTTTALRTVEDALRARNVVVYSYLPGASNWGAMARLCGVPGNPPTVYVEILDRRFGYLIRRALADLPAGVQVEVF